MRGQERGRFPRRQRHLEAVQRQPQTIAPRLDIGFLAGPAIEERPGPVLGVQRAQGGHLRAREEVLRDRIGRGLGSDALEVDADLASEGDRAKGPPVGIGEVEADGRRRVARSQGRLAPGAVREAQRRGAGAEVASEDRAQKPAPGDEARAVPLEVEALRSRALVVGERVPELPEVLRVGVQRGAPDVDLVVRERDTVAYGPTPVSGSRRYRRRSLDLALKSIMGYITSWPGP